MIEEQTQQCALIVEDEGMTVLLLKRALTRGGYEVVGAVPDGGQAIVAARTLKPDFIIMDINMPRMNGIEATRQIIAERHVPIVMLTAYSDEALVEEASTAGACAYLVKPLTVDQIIPAACTALANSRKSCGAAPTLTPLVVLYQTCLVVL